jgi:hypothetical protein
MAIGSTQLNLTETYAKIKKASQLINSLSLSSIARIDQGDVYYTYLVSNFIPTMRVYLLQLPDSNLFSNAWVAKLDAYASAQVLDPSTDFKADYDSLRDASSLAISAAVEALPTSNGRVVIQSFANDGAETIDIAQDLSALKIQLQLLAAASA